MMEQHVIDHLHRLARIDGFAVKQAQTKAQAKAWQGSVAIFEGPHFRFASDSHHSLRGWIHTHAHKRTA